LLNKLLTIKTHKRVMVIKTVGLLDELRNLVE